MSTVKWNIKEHYVAGEFAGYVVVTNDKYEDVVCCGIGADQRDDAVLIAAAPEIYEGLKEIRDVMEKDGRFCRTVEAIDKLLKKARGEA